MPGSDHKFGQSNGVVAVGLIVGLGIILYCAVAPIFGWPQLQ